MSDEVLTSEVPEDPAQRMFAALRQLVELPSADFENLIQVLQTPLHRRSVMVEAVINAVPQIDRSTAGDALAGAIGYMAGWLAGGRSIGSIEKRIVAATYGDSAHDPQQLKRLLATPAVRLTAGAVSAAQSRGQEVASLQMRMDLSPVTTAEKPGSVMVPTFTLGVDLLSPSGDVDRRTTVTMDIDDLRNLRNEVDARFAELEAIQANLESAGITLWIEGERSDDDAD